MASIEKWLVGLLLFSGVVIGFTAFSADLGSHANPDLVVQNLSEQNSALGQVQEQTKELENAVQGASFTGIGVIDAAATFFVSIYAVLKLVLTGLTALVGSLITSLGAYFNVDGWVIGIFTAIATVALIFAIIKAWLGHPV